MNIIKEMKELDQKYLEAFTNKIEMTWGEIYFNTEAPNYYDANHAYIDEEVVNPQEVIKNVIEFYESKDLIPRFYIYNLNKQQNLIKALEENGFRDEVSEHILQLFNTAKFNKINFPENISIEIVDERNYQDSLNIQCQIEELGGENVRKDSFPLEFKNKNYKHYLLKYNNTPCSVACIFQHKDQAILEVVATLKEFRNKGLIGKLINYIQDDMIKSNISKFWVSPINEQVEKVYVRYGFETVGKFKTMHAFLRGMSIAEIREKAR